MRKTDETGGKYFSTSRQQRENADEPAERLPLWMVQLPALGYHCYYMELLHTYIVVGDARRKNDDMNVNVFFVDVAWIEHRWVAWLAEAQVPD